MAEHSELPTVLEAVAPHGRHSLPEPPGELRPWLVTVGHGFVVPGPRTPAAEVRRYLDWRATWADVTILAPHTVLADTLADAGTAGERASAALHLSEAATGWVEIDRSELSVAGAAMVDSEDALARRGLAFNPAQIRFLRQAVGRGLRNGLLWVGPLIWPPDLA